MTSPIKASPRKGSPHKASPHKGSPRKGKSPFKKLTNPLRKVILQRRKSSVTALFSQNKDNEEEPIERKRPFSLVNEGNDVCKKDRQTSFADIDFAVPMKKKKPSTPEKKKVTELPRDLRLGTKISVISDIKFPFSSVTSGETTLRLNEDAAKKILERNTVCAQCSSNLPSDCCPDSEDLLQAACLYYKYPCLPGLRSFPRLEGGTEGTVMERSNNEKLPRSYLNGIVDEWIGSFDNLFNLWKDGDLDSFYYCAAKFTVLFLKEENKNESVQELSTSFVDEQTCMGFSDSLQYKAIVTPCPRGLRKVLHESEIKYSHVFNNKRRSLDENDSSSTLNDTCGSFNGDSLERSFGFPSISRLRERTPEPENVLIRNAIDDFVSPLKLGDEVDNEVFMLGLGLSPSTVNMRNTQESLSNFPSESQDSIKATSQAGSTIVINDIQSIDAFRSLCNNKLGWAKSGPDAGIPPTLISSQPFKYAPARSLELKSQTAIKPSGVKYIVEAKGPILPHVHNMFMDFLHKCQNQVQSDKSINFHITGRAPYDGFNEAVSDSLKNINNYSFDPKSKSFSY